MRPQTLECIHELQRVSFVSSDEVDEIEVYGSEAQSGTLLTTYSFEVKKNAAAIVSVSHCFRRR